ncbi:hypothetical protein ACFO4P_04145 [Epilithonimonas pallida]|uniref:Uncharacterized protein n=1 Tax=Epilithonimonas pallida TaxID=373671 RepID=A0ABY1R0C9_9FLAO|nr:hypothetical protein [Epilithonimonas pallida]SMP90543.1 hypothetical protein SAMN05421679_102365 [Epilithonimonas pallida]
MYNAGSKDYAFANSSNISGDTEINDGKLFSGGWSASGITDMDTGKVLFDPSYLGTKQMIKFAGTWYHETIHSIHVISGFYKQTVLKFAKNGYDYDTARFKARYVSETIAHLQTRNYGLGLTFGTLNSTIRNYGASYIEFLSLK